MQFSCELDRRRAMREYSKILVFSLLKWSTRHFGALRRSQYRKVSRNNIAATAPGPPRRGPRAAGSAYSRMTLQILILRANPKERNKQIDYYTLCLILRFSKRHTLNSQMTCAQLHIHTRRYKGTGITYMYARFLVSLLLKIIFFDKNVI